MTLAAWFKPPRHLVTLFFLAALASTAALGWLTWQLLASDRMEAKQRLVVDRERAADAAALVLDRALAALVRRLEPGFGPAFPDALPDASVLLNFGDGRFSVVPAGALPYVPELPSRPSLEGKLADAFRAEIAGDLVTAARGYSAHVKNADRELSALALTRLARVQRRQHGWQGSLRTYDTLAALGNVGVDGMSALLVARLGRISIFEEGRPDPIALREEATRLRDDLARAAIPLTKAQHSFYVGEIGRWLGEAAVPHDVDADARVRADAFAWLWAHRNDEIRANRGRRLVRVGDAMALVGWQWLEWPDTGSVFILGPSSLRAMAGASVPPGFGWSLTSLEGDLIAGDAPPARDESVRAGLGNGLPISLHVFSSATAATPSSRRAYLIAVLISVAGILAAAWYFIWRGISREARVARLQSDFVAAVSHEFRSPLTSLRHLAELLATDRMSTEERKRRSYELMLAETDRLGRLVEGLLDFGRLQAGAGSFRFEPVNVPALAREVVSDFSRRLEPEGHQVDLSTESSLSAAATATADREALSRVLWNLLDNAVKYSPDHARVQVAVAADPAGRNLFVSVTDSGLGIPPHEQAQIFDRFVRGADAKARRIRGTGIGLSMARDIMRAHDGDITLKSSPGHGSTFTISVPVAPPNHV